MTALNDRVHYALSVVAGPAHAAVNTFQSRWIHAIGSSSYACLCCARKQVSALNANRKVFRALVETTLFHTVTAIHKRLLECGIMEPRHAFLDIRIERKRSAGDHAGRGRVGRGPITALPAAVTSWPAHVTVSRVRLTQSHQVPHGGARGRRRACRDLPPAGTNCFKPDSLQVANGVYLGNCEVSRLTGWLVLSRESSFHGFVGIFFQYCSCDAS